MKFFNALRTTWNAPESNRVWLSLVLNAAQQTAEIVISGQIGKNWWDDSGISGKEFRNALSQVPAGHKINLRINSEGGSVQDGLDIFNAIKERREDVTAHISGYAVSIASVIPLAAARVISPVSSIWMIHEPWCMAQGDAAEFLKAAEMLEKHGDMLAQIYAEETGNSRKAVREAMKAETWFTGKEAVAYGLADDIEHDDEETISNLRKLTDCPKAMKAMPVAICNSISALKQGANNPNPQNSTTMNKKLIVALLKKHGIEATETETEEQLQAKLDLIPQAKAEPAKTATATGADNADANAKMEKIIRDRLKDKVEAFVTAGKITKAEVTIFVNAALADEDGTFKILDEKTVTAIGGDPAGSGVEMRELPRNPAGLVGATTDMLKNMVTSCNGDRKAAYAKVKDNWDSLILDARRRDAAKNENTFSSSLTTNFLILGATTQASPKFAPVKMFTRDTSVDPYKPLATGQLKFNTTSQDGTTTLTNATNFESGDATVTNVAVTVSQYTEAFHITNSQLNSGLRMEDLIESKLASLGSKVMKVLNTNITAANFATLSPVIRSQAAFGYNDTQAILGALAKANRKNMMLSGVPFYKLTNQPSFFQKTATVAGAGWKDVIGLDYLALNTEFSTAGANIYGFACDPQALGIIAGLPLMDAANIPGGIFQYTSGMIPGVEMPIMVSTWFNTSTRTYWGAFDLMFGANALDTTIGLVIASGTPT